MTLIDTLIQVTPIDENPTYTLPGGLDVYVSLLPPGVAIGISVPPFTLILDVDQVAELVAALTAAAAGL